MGKSVSAPGSEPSGAFEHKPSGSFITVTRTGGVMHHNLRERGLTADYPIAYSIGFGKVGRSYLIDLGGHLFQSPASYYVDRAEWGISPGYETERVLDFSRPITSDCIFCHADRPAASAPDRKLAPISCDRCHGPGERHREHPIPGSIVNPAKLAVRQRDSICEQCHLETSTVVLNSGKYWWEFQPGDRLEQVETNFVSQGKAGNINAVSQAEQLARSACWLRSNGKLWCGTCHDPHGQPVNRKQQIKQVCESCHPASAIAASHAAPEDDCASCHMPPTQARDISHASITDHRIRRRPSEGPSGENIAGLHAWRAPDPNIAERALGLATFYVAKQQRSPAGLSDAYQILSQMRPAQQDAPVLAAMGYILLGEGRAQPSVRWFTSAVAQSPGSAEYWLDLAVAQEASGNISSAGVAFRRSIGANPYDYRPYLGLSALYGTSHQLSESKSVIDQYLNIVPQSIVMRLRR